MNIKRMLRKCGYCQLFSVLPQDDWIVCSGECIAVLCSETCAAAHAKAEHNGEFITPLIPANTAGEAYRWLIDSDAKYTTLATESTRGGARVTIDDVKEKLRRKPRIGDIVIYHDKIRTGSALELTEWPAIITHVADLNGSLVGLQVFQAPGAMPKFTVGGATTDNLLFASYGVSAGQWSWRD